MAVAGLRKASVPDSFLGDNHSSASRRCGNNERSTTQTSFIRKMWRDLESETRAGENGRWKMSEHTSMPNGPESPCSSYLECESMESEYTSMDANGFENDCLQSPSQSQRASEHGQEDDKRSCLHHSPSFDVTEKERVRKKFHQWGTKSFEAHRLCNSRTNNSSRAQWFGANERKRVRIVREWIESSTQQGDTCQTGSNEAATEIGTQIKQDRDGTVDCGAGARSSIRRIYGRQALLDLLAKFNKERKREVDDLLENRFVSNFGHRHRIQVDHVVSRFLYSGKCPLDILYARDLLCRKLLISMLYCKRESATRNKVTLKHEKGFLSRLSNYSHAAEGAQSDSDTSSDSEMTYNRTEQSDKIVEKFEPTNSTCEWEFHNPPEIAFPTGERHDKILHEKRYKLPLNVGHSQSDSGNSSNKEMKHEGGRESEETVQEIQDEIREELATTNLTIDLDSCNPQEFSSSLGERRDHDESVEANHRIYNIEMSQGRLNTECITPGPLPEQEDDNNNNNDVWNHSTRIESDVCVDVNSDYNEFEWYQETIRGDIQESHEEWFDNDNILEDSTESWYGGTSYLEAALLDGSNTFNASDVDNDRRVELRELTSRGSVSNLLQSDFGARLNQLLQSYVARQDQAFESENGWMQDEGHQSLDENADGSEVVDTEGAADREIQDFHENLNLVAGRAIINGLRIDMGTLKQRMDDMQKMVEACMNMQCELQRSVQQEIYSALDRSSNSGDGIWNHQFKSRSGMEGVCFLCCDDACESLPNRSVHMYICSRCAEKINWSKLKESVRHP